MSSRIYKRGDAYYIDCRINGKRIRRSAGPTRAHAEVLIDSLLGPASERVREEAKPKNGRPQSKSVPFSALVQRYLERQQIHAKAASYQSADTCCRRLLVHFGERDVSKLLPKNLEDFIAQRLRSISREGVNRELRYLKALLRQAVEEGTIAALPFKIRMLRTTRKLPTILSPEELRHFLDTAGPRLRPLLITAAMTGLRNSELRSLWWEDVDFNNQTLTVRAKPELDFSPKSHAEREIPLNSKVLEILQKHRRGLSLAGPRDLVFPRNPRTGSRWDASALCGAVKKIFVNAGLADPKLRPGLHLLRRCFASHALASGTDMQTVRELGGWASLGVVERYVRSSDRLKRAAVERLSKLAS